MTVDLFPSICDNGASVKQQQREYNMNIPIVNKAPITTFVFALSIIGSSTFFAVIANGTPITFDPANQNYDIIHELTHTDCPKVALLLPVGDHDKMTDAEFKFLIKRCDHVSRVKSERQSKIGAV